MPTFVYRPTHPDADEFGHVEKSKALEWDYFNSDDKQAIIGNEFVKLNFISDNMDSTRHMANGKYYTSKNEFRKATKAAGCIEIGNESLKRPSAPKLDRRQRRDDIRKAIHQLKNNKRT